VEQAMEMLGGPDVPEWAPGRAGRRIRALESVVRELVARGSATAPPDKLPRTGTGG
jgi:hypothetical protein